MRFTIHILHTVSCKWAHPSVHLLAALVHGNESVNSNMTCPIDGTAEVLALFKVSVRNIALAISTQLYKQKL